MVQVNQMFQWFREKATFKRIFSKDGLFHLNLTLNVASVSQKSQELTSPPADHPFGFGGESSSKFDFFSSGGMFGGSTSQEETGNAGLLLNLIISRYSLGGFRNLRRPIFQIS